MVAYFRVLNKLTYHNIFGKICLHFCMFMYQMIQELFTLCFFIQTVYLPVFQSDSHGLNKHYLFSKWTLPRLCLVCQRNLNVNMYLYLKLKYLIMVTLALHNSFDSKYKRHLKTVTLVFMIKGQIPYYKYPSFFKIMY